MSLPVAVVTGGSAGIGLAIVRHLLDAGYEVINLSRRGSPDTHANLHDYKVDLSDRAATGATARRIAKDFQVTHLVHNAGEIRPGSLEETTHADLAHVTSLHLAAPLTLTQAFLPAMREAGIGRIVFISTRAVQGKPLRSVYSATKAGMIGYARTWALELGGDGITVNVIAPGPIAIELFRNGNPEDSEATKKIIEGLAVKRIGEPDDIARAAMFFLDPRNGFVTGQTLYVCGGLSVGNSPL
jgi:NAD(P)-dependent dehydrogenase (short-subunit alcohol dehydrogenase family)